MTITRRTRAAACLLFLGLVCLIGVSAPAAEEDLGDPLIEMIVDLLGDSDRDMRALGLEQVREEAPGEAATNTFAALLPTLPAAGQVGLLEALGDRGDMAARPAALEMLASEEQAVRAAALSAVGALGKASDVPLFARNLAAGTELECDAARGSLVRLRGEEVNAQIVSAMADSEPAVRIGLLGVLASRNAKDALDAVLANTEHDDAAVRLAALGALRFLADESHTATLVEILKAGKNDRDRRQAELALLVVCSRGREACAGAVIAGLDGADVPARVVLMRALARAGGQNALAELLARLEDDDEAVRIEALRMFSVWPDPSVAPKLLAIARTGDDLRRQVLAIRGLVRLASPRQGEPADLAMLAEVMGLATRPQEKRLVLGVLGSLEVPEAIAAVAPLVENAELSEEASLAAVMIAEKMKDAKTGEVRTTLEKVQKLAKSPQLRLRAKRILDSQ